ncbi:hypothetical protein DDF67_03315 [Caulobacter endophyticus]|uniref:Uncharacterized protein n=1 Tax=Caulobacter endophyticus TaxID=2172652 RepID=A0A2T9KBY4_9CAUL|nr:hypothetical protein DDF67_03315 [Caulobacter endophyticus]
MQRGRWSGAIGDVTEGATAGTEPSLAPSTTSWSPSPASGGGEVLKASSALNPANSVNRC